MPFVLQSLCFIYFISNYLNLFTKVSRIYIFYIVHPNLRIFSVTIRVISTYTKLRFFREILPKFEYSHRILLNT